MTELNDEITAYHEAGHAVVQLLFGDEVGQLEIVTIVRDGQAAGHAAIDRAGHDALRYREDTVKQVIFERVIMVTLAGEIAQRKFSPDSVDEDHAAADRYLAEEYLEELDTHSAEIREAYIHLLHLRTAALIDREWAGVERVARALVERKTLTGAEVQEAFADPRFRSMWE